MEYLRVNYKALIFLLSVLSIFTTLILASQSYNIKPSISAISVLYT